MHFRVLARAAALALFSLALIAPATAQRAAGPSAGPTIDIGGRLIALVVPDGHCVLDRRNPSDRNLIELVERLLAGVNQLHAVTTDCRELDDWRQGRRATLSDYTQVQHPLQLTNEDFRGRESQIIRELCHELRQQSVDTDRRLAAEIHGRIERGREQIKVDNVAFLGVLDEDQHACYAALLIKGRTEAGAEKEQLCVFANMILNGRLVYLYAYTDVVSPASAENLLRDRKLAAHAHLLANQRN